MKDDTLRRVQLEILSIAKEIKRVCEENSIPYFLESGTLLGAVRHGGFIPWDDDMDIGMLREDYERFCAIAPEALGEEFVFQCWHSDARYPLPFGKVRRRGTVYEERKSKRLSENGFFVDIFPYDFAPEDETRRSRLRKRLCHIERMLLMKCGFRPWQGETGVDLKKRVGYAIYQIAAGFCSRKKLIGRYEKLVLEVWDRETVYEQTGKMGLFYFPAADMRDLDDIRFEDSVFKAPAKAQDWLRRVYGDYCRLPPEEERINRHSIREIDFGDRGEREA